MRWPHSLERGRTRRGPRRPRWGTSSSNGERVVDGAAARDVARRRESDRAARVARRVDEMVGDELRRADDEAAGGRRVGPATTSRPVVEARSSAREPAGHRAAVVVGEAHELAPRRPHPEVAGRGRAPPRAVDHPCAPDARDHARAPRRAERDRSSTTTISKSSAVWRSSAARHRASAPGRSAGRHDHRDPRSCRHPLEPIERAPGRSLIVRCAMTAPRPVAARQRGVALARRHTHPQFAGPHGAAARYDPDVSVFAALGDDTDAAWRDLARWSGPAATRCCSGAELPQPPPAGPGCGGGRRPPDGAARAARVDAPACPTPAPGPGRRRRDAGPGRAHPPRPVRGPHRRARRLRRRVRRRLHWSRWPGSASHLRGSARSARCAHIPTSAVGGSPPGSPRSSPARILDRGEHPFLHHAADNDPARRVYEALGLRVPARGRVRRARGAVSGTLNR